MAISCHITWYSHGTCYRRIACHSCFCTFSTTRVILHGIANACLCIVSRHMMLTVHLSICTHLSGCVINSIRRWHRACVRRFGSLPRWCGVCLGFVFFVDIAATDQQLITHGDVHRRLGDCTAGCNICPDLCLCHVCALLSRCWRGVPLASCFCDIFKFASRYP